MKRKLAIGVLIVVPLIVGIIIGHEVRRANEPAPQQMADALMQQVPHVGLMFGADLKPVKTSFEDWVYPESTKTRSGSSMSGSVKESPFEFQRRIEVTTDDDFEIVAKHYSEKLRYIMRLGDDSDWSLPPDGSGGADFNGVLVSYSMRRPSRAVEVGEVGLLAKNCNLHIVISRNKDEDSTYVSILFSKWFVDSQLE